MWYFSKNLHEVEAVPLEMATLGESNLVAICQLACTADKEKNLADAKILIARGVLLGAKMIFLPEAVDFLTSDRERVYELAEPMDGPTVHAYQDIAKQHGVWLSAAFHIKSDDPAESKRVYNRHMIINDVGEVVSTYDKIHLFDATLNTTTIQESSWTIPGEGIVPPVVCPVGNVGQCICYDLRFPEIALSLAKQGSDIIIYPSAFTQSTGAAHWESLLRARAIETQCYVIAAGQASPSGRKKSLYGHSMVIDPWGQVVASCHEGMDVCIANIDRGYLQRIRKKMPVLSHRRNDVYKLSKL